MKARRISSIALPTGVRTIDAYRDGLPSISCWASMKPSAFLCGSLLMFTQAFAAPRTEIEITFVPVGTADVIGPNQVHSAEFVAPVVEFISLPANAKCLLSTVGEYESFIDKTGKQTGLHSMHKPVAGTKCEKQHLFPALLKWQFKPAKLSGAPTSVYFRYLVNMGNVQPR